MKGITKSLGQKNNLDKFYTKPEIAQFCLNHLDITKYDNIIEPSAGNGSFLKLLPANAIGYDIAPEGEKIIKADFLKLTFDLKGSTLVIGNPPFGVQNNLAIDFFNKSAQFATTIAFIVPRSFRKISIQNRLNLNFKLVSDIDLPEKSFTLLGTEYNLPTCFQIWERQPIPRLIIKPKMSSKYIIFTKDIEIADFRIQRVGGQAGKAFLDKNGAVSSNYYIINKSKYSTEQLIQIINNICFPTISDTVGPKSLPKGELCEELDLAIESVERERKI